MYKVIFRLAIFSLLFPLLAKAQTKTCDIHLSGTNGCAPFPVKFSPITSGTPTRYIWYFGDGDSSSQKEPSHVYTKPGKYYPILLVYYADGTSCNINLKKPVQVYGSPTAAMNVKTEDTILCHRGQKICFKDFSKRGTAKAPIVNWLWSFGDGNLDLDPNPCYAYSDSGQYLVSLEVTDSNGCKSLIQHKLHVSFAEDLGIKVVPKFVTNSFYDCKKNQVVMSFTNKTDTAGNYITQYTWDFGDSTSVSCDLSDPNCLKNWAKQSHIYSKPGQFNPSLTVHNRFGCVATYILDTSIDIPQYKFGVTIWPDTVLCLKDAGQLELQTPFNPYASYYMWDFNDPLDSGLGRTPGIMHQYKLPGTYTVTLKVKIGSCIFDTVLCHKIHILGPQAFIMPNKAGYKAPDSIPPTGSWLIKSADYPTYFDTGCYAPLKVRYYVYDTIRVAKGDTTYSWCKPDTIKIVKDTIYDCVSKKNVIRDRAILKPGVVSVKDLVKPFATLNYWYKGDPYPSGPVYRDSVFINDPLVMDDTSLIAPQCHGPHTVTFTNFSRKNRGYFAVDNNPLDLPDTCLNPSYPHASDSLIYSWNFQEGDPTISTRKNPDPRSHISEEVNPTHIFQKDGCYWVKLQVTDSKTGCADVDSIPIVLQQADAGWGPEYSNIKNMTWLNQDTLKPGFPRRGMILHGPPCVADKQGIDLSETLPGCFKPFVYMVLDSAANVIDCDTNHIHWKWKNKKDLEKLNYQWTYNDTGWKTVGLVIRNNTNCYDTVWYHNYKYIFQLYPNVETSAKQLCPGSKVTLKLADPNQEGIQLYYLKYAYVGVDDDTFKTLPHDTTRYRIINHNGVKGMVTSTVHHQDWGIDDGALNFNYLTDSFVKTPDTPGHFVIKAYMYSRFGCKDSFETQVMVGHFSRFVADNQIICVHDTVHFDDMVRYFRPVAEHSSGIDNVDYWANPAGMRGGKKPAIPEKMEWDFDGDGKTDTVGPQPYHVYNKPGYYTVRLTTYDSLGCKQVLEKKNYIRVIDAVARFVVDSPGDTRFCAPHFFRFLDSSYVIDPEPDSTRKLKITSWTWDFGEGNPPINITDPTKRNAANLYLRNGEYNVTLKVNTSVSGGKSCQASFSHKIKIIGPTADFEPVSDLEGCAPFAVKVHDKTLNATIREWRLGDGTSISSGPGDDTVTLVYTKPGTYCPYVIVIDTIHDLQGNVLYCKDSFPEPKCKYKVIVHAPNTIKLTASDTVLCVNETRGLFSGKPDTGYVSWTLDYGNGITATNKKPSFSYTYPKTGIYKLTLYGQGAYCPDTTHLKVRVIDVKSVIGLDTAQRDTPSFVFVNHSLNGRRYKWEFDDGTPPLETTSMDPITHEFKRSGNISVCLTAYNEKNCADKSCLDINILTDLFIPNVFTPQGDAYNNTFHIRIVGEREYYLRIFNRWGEEVFQSTDKTNTWDGTDERTSLPCAPGVYFYLFTYRLIGGSTKSVTGTVTLIR